ncbi:hybrid sensor histidine kinase/response regulator transcription factor [Arcticibacter tournemirensis]
MLSRLYPFILFCVPLLLYKETKAQSLQYQFSALNISQGLSHNQVNCIFKDRKGFMWFGTMSGLNRFDGYTFKVFRHVIKDSTSINDDNIINIQQGPENKLWVQTRMGFVIYDPVKERFDRRPELFLSRLKIKGTLLDLRDDRRGRFWIITSSGLYYYKEGTVNAVLVKKTTVGFSALNIDKRGGIWVVYNNGLIERIDSRGSSLQTRFKPSFAGGTASWKLFIDKDDDLWVYAVDQPRGVVHINPSNGVTEYYTTDSGRFRLNTNNIYSISEDNSGIIWVGTDHGGINLLNKKTGKVTYLLNRESDEKSLAQNSTPVIYRDNNGVMWVGTFKKGISYYHESIIKFPLYRHQPKEPNSLSYEDVNRFVEDAKGNLWIGTNGGGLVYFDRQKNSFLTFKHEPGNSNSLSNDVVVSLCIDHQQKLWVGTYFGGLDCFDGKTFTHYRYNNSDSSSLSDDRVWEIMEDSNKDLWIGTLAGGLNRFIPEKRSFERFKSGPNSIQSNYIAALLEDRRGNIWIATDNGIDIKMKRSGKFVHYAHSEKDNGSLSNNNVISLLEDSAGRIWAGTQDGLNIYDWKKGKFRRLRSTDGLPDNTILTILEDSKGNIWLSTPNGICCIHTRKNGTGHYIFRNYDELDGLQGRGFNENAALKTRRGELIFGGANGFNLFSPEAISVSKKAPAVVFTDFQLFNRSVLPGEAVDGNGILKHSISETSEIILNYDQNVFSIEFAALNFSNAAKNKYAYKLEGFNTNWLTTDSRNRKATYTNLDPGEYIFRVRASNDSGVWNNDGSSLKITIRPPFWKTPLAYAAYIVAILGLLLYIRWRGIKELKSQFAVEQERQEAQRMHELDMMKIKFFTNVSHEFRTPLSLILSPLDKLLKNISDSSDEKRHLQLIQRNARRLLNLVNQLMDFRKMEVNELKLQLEEGDIVDFIKESFQSFTDLAEKKDIRFSLKSALNNFVTAFDHDKVDRILFNLLSNAFKFTSDGGTISLELALEQRAGEAYVLKISIRDSGIGIPKEKQELIFERFFQNDVPGSMVNQGSGIGLAITREFVNLHHGTIRVDSEPNKGSCFTVELPVKASGQILSTVIDEPGALLKGREEFSEKRLTILLVEDNEDFRFYLKDNLRQYYNVIEAENGKTGWARALGNHPDLIVSDISMPEMNGIDLCLKIRNDKRTVHIPVILLTAMTGEEQLLRGLETGASDYMTKPFNFEILISKIKNLLTQHESLRKTYQRQVEVKPTEIDVVSADEKFIRQALAIIERNISNPDFSVEEFSKEMCMSRVALYKKLLQLTRQTPSEFIRTIRLKRAALLLDKSQTTVSEIAYEVGFNNPKAFAKYFKTEFGVLPSSWSKLKKEDNSE